MTFDEYKKSLKKEVPKEDPLTIAASKALEIGEDSVGILGKIEQQAARKTGHLAKSLIGDIPFVRNILPEKVRDMKVRSGVETAYAALPRLARDMYGLGKISKLGSGLKYLLGAGAYGAATADSENPKDIAVNAATTAALFKATDIAFKKAPKVVKWAYEKLPAGVKEKVSKLGQSIGTSLKKYTDITKAQFKRHADIKVKQIESAQFKQALQEGLPDVADREALTFMIEKTGVPAKLGKPEIIASLKSDKRPILKHWAEQLGKRFNAAYEEMLKTYGDDVGFQKDYINRLWDIPKNKEKNVLNWFSKRTNHQNQRLIKTVQEGVNRFKLKPKTLDAAELINYYENNVYNAMANENFIKAASKVKTNGVLPSGKTGLVKAIQRADKAPKDWIEISHPAINRALGVRNKAGKLVMRNSPVKVHPDIAEELKAILGSKSEHGLVRALEGINAYAKHSSLALSLFHHIALAEAGIASGVNVPRVMLRSIRQMKRGEKPLLTDPRFKDAVTHGVEIGSPTDVYRNLVEESLINVNKELGKRVVTKPLKLATKPVEWIVNKNNKFLWDYLHPNLKLYGYEQGVQSMLKHPKFKNVPIDQIKRSVGQLVNDTFGGQSWELLAKSPQWRQSMHFAMLSPDWNLSTVRQFGSIFGSGGRSKIDNEIRQELGGDFWKTGAIVMFGGMNQLNKMFTKMHLGKARNMWDNEPGHKTHLFIGKNPDGTNRYLRWGKQFREVPELFMKPTEKIVSKASPLLRGAVAQGFPNKWSKIPESEGFNRIKARAEEAGKMFTPYSIQNQVRRGNFSPLQFALPESKGLTYYKAKEELLKAIKSGDKKRIKSVTKFVTENGHDVVKMLNTLTRDTQKTKGTADWKSAMKVYNNLVNAKDRKQALKKMIDNKAITDAVAKKVLKIIKEKSNASKQYKILKNL